MITSDDHAGLRAARLAVFGGIPGSAASFTCNKMLKPTCRTKICRPKWPMISARSSMLPIVPLLTPIWPRRLQNIRPSASRLSEWMAINIPEGLMVFSFPGAFRKLLRTTNGVERLHREVRRRARVVSIFPNKASCLRLVSAVFNEISEEWLTGRTYMTFEGST